MVKYREEVYFGQFEKPDRFIFSNPLLQKYAWTETHIRNWRQKKRRI